MRRPGLTYGELAAVIVWLLDVRHSLTCPACRLDVPVVPGVDNGRDGT